jgi:NADH-quinone oxidoreductase subunit N
LLGDEKLVNNILIPISHFNSILVQINDQINHVLGSLSQLLPELTLVLGFLFFIIADLFLTKNPNQRFTRRFVVLVLLLVGYAVFLEMYVIDIHRKGQFLFDKMLFQDSKAALFKEFIIIYTLFVCVHTFVFEKAAWKESLQHNEFYIILLSIVLGLLLMTMAVNLVSLFVAIELVSIGSYLLVALPKQQKNLEAAINYLIFGATSSAIMLYGFSLLYGMTGDVVFVEEDFAQKVFNHQPLLVFTASLMAMGGLLFKIAAAPFHVWTPDVYQNAPTPVVSFLSVLPKIAALLALMRFLEGIHFEETRLLIGVISASLIIGNFSALRQVDAKKMLAYSSIAHAGFMLVGLCVSSEIGMQSATFYVLTYGLINVAAFFLLDILAINSGSVAINSFAGLGKKSPWLGICAVLIAIALVGLPPTVGFSGKLLIFTALWDGFQTSGDKYLFFLLIFGLINAAISLFYYLKIPFEMFFRESQNEAAIEITLVQQIILTVLTIAIVWLFFQPEILMRLVERI